MYVLYRSEKEYQQHSKAIHSIADHYKLKEALIREIYEGELKDLQKTSRLKNFLSVLVTRHVKEFLYKSKLITSK